MSKEIVKKQESLPAEFAQYAGQGQEDITADVIDKSFIKMAHSDVKDTDIKFGDFYDDTAKKSLGKKIIVTVVKTDAKIWRKFNDDFALVGTSTDGITWDSDDLLTEDEKWQCRFLDFWVLLDGDKSGFPYVISLHSTSFKKGKKWMSQLAKNIGSGEPIFGRNFELTTSSSAKGNKEYSVIEVALCSGFNKNLAEAAKVREMIKGLTAVMNQTEAEPEEVMEPSFVGEDVD